MADIPSLLKIKLLSIQDYSDLTLTCDGEDFKVHKAVVCTQSPVIAAALRGNFLEAKNNVVNVSFDITSVRRLVQFMYTGDYEMSPNQGCFVTGFQDADTALSDSDTGVLEPSESASDRLICHSLMNSIADYYDISTLAKLSQSKAQEILANEWSAESFYAMVQRSLSSINDRNFLRMLGTEAAEHFDEVLVRYILDEDGPGERLAPYALSKCISKLAAAETSERQLISDIQSEKEARERISQKSSHMERSVNGCIQLLKRHKSCRNARCEAEFACYFDHKGPSHEPTYILRCAHCRCRHD
ncbi:hypothetical protein F4861DRAFT_174521 [Xylaria intraflava]|nr:hypothetical protein F4861DRAFT_174521 [Xylaria intraflava]